MAFKVEFGFHTKRYNSTYQLKTGVYTKAFETNVVLKENTSVVSPVFILNVDTEKVTKDTINVSEINYCHCPQFLRYYWVTDIVWVTDRIAEFYCVIDVLASHLDTQIKPYTGYIQYCSDKEISNTELDDDRLVPDLVVNVNKSKLITVFSTALTIVVQTKILGGTGCRVVTYAMEPSTYDALAIQLYNMSGTFGDAIQYIANTVGGLGSIADYLVDVYAVPVPYSAFKSSLADIWIANFQIKDATSGQPLQAKAYSGTYTEWESWCNTKDLSISTSWNQSIIPTVSGNAHDGKAYFLRGSKYLKLALKHPCGCEEFSSDVLIKAGNKLSIGYKVIADYLHGDYNVEIWDSEFNNLLCSASGNVKVPMQSVVGGASSIAGISNIVSKGLGLFAQGMSTGAENASVTQKGKTRTDQKTLKNGTIRTTTTQLEPTITYSKPSSGDMIASVVGSFTHGQKTVSPGQGGVHEGNFASLLMSFLQKDNTGSGTIDNSWMFSILGVLVEPTVCQTDGDYLLYTELFGYPCSKFTSINSSSIAKGSYIQFAKASLPMSSVAGKALHSEEIIALNGFLNTGFFYDE